jgi:hypothetical protein
MSEPLVLDSHGFKAFIEDLARISGKDFVPVLIDQVGTVLDLCIARSPDPWKGNSRSDVKKKVQFRVEKPGRYVGLDGSVVDSTRNRVPRPLDGTPILQTLTGRRGGQEDREWYIGRDRAGKRVFIPEERLKTTKYFLLAAQKFGIYQVLEPKAEAAIAAIGSIKKSWVDIADAVGAPLRKSPAWLKKVRSHRNDGERSRVQIDSVAAFVEVVNTNCQLIQQYNGGAILQGAMDTRLKAFLNDLKAGTFKDLEYRASRYPGIFTKP